MPSSKVVFWGVDVQADFMLPGGKLYVPGAEKIIPNIRRLVSGAIDAHVPLVSSGDSHPENDPEFETFPPHCLRGSPGARILPEGLAGDFRLVPNSASHKLLRDICRFPQVILEKQTLDVFDNPHASEIVEQFGPDAQYVVFGVVTEYCVRCAVRGLLDRGRKVDIVSDAIETLNPADGAHALDELQALGAYLLTTDEALRKLNAVSHQQAARAPAGN